MMVVVDGRTDKDKLKELLSLGAERTELDYKEALDLGEPRHELDFVKDAVSMFNHFPGGYIIVGATDDGKPSPRADETDWGQLDGSKLTAKVRKYVSVPLTPVSAIHELDGHKYCLVCFQSPLDGLPVPFTKMGQFVDENGKQKTVFRVGEFIRRDGASNRPIEYSQWSEILQEHDRRIRSDESKRINALVDKITIALGEKGKTPPLVYGMDDEALGNALRACCEQEDAGRLKRFINCLGMELETNPDTNNIVETLAIIACHAIAFSIDEVTLAAIDTLYNWYMAMERFGPNDGKRKLALANACYEIGANLVLAKKWNLIESLANRQSPAYNTNYWYASWIRDCQVAASNAYLFDKDQPGMMISQACSRMCERPLLVPAIEQQKSANNQSELLLNLLCSFDFLYCLVVFVAGDGKGDAYPACVAFSQNRISGTLAVVFGKNDRVRRSLLPNNTDIEIANGLIELCKLIQTQSMQASRFWWNLDLDMSVTTFVASHTADEGPNK